MNSSIFYKRLHIAISKVLYTISKAHKSTIFKIKYNAIIGNEKQSIFIKLANDFVKQTVC